MNPVGTAAAQQLALFDRAGVTEGVAEGAAEKVQDAAGLSDALLRLARDPAERARRGALGQALVERNRGTLQRLMALLEPLISGSPPP